MKALLSFLRDILPFVISAVWIGLLLLQAQNSKNADCKPCYRFSKAMLLTSVIFWFVFAFWVYGYASLINIPSRRGEFCGAMLFFCFWTYHLMTVATTKVYINDGSIVKKTLFGTRTMAINDIVKVKNLGLLGSIELPTYCLIDSRNRKMALSHYLVGIEKALNDLGVLTLDNS